MFKIIYVAICLLNVCMLMDLACMAQHEIDENDMHPTRAPYPMEKISALLRLVIMTFVPIINVLFCVIFIITLGTEEGREAYLVQVLENYE